MNEWQPPAEGAGPPIDPEVDEAALHRGLSFARPVAVGLFLTGLLHAANVLQIVLFAWRQSPGIVIGEVLSALFVVLFIGVGARIYEGSYPFTFVGAAVAFAAGLFAFVWFVVLFVFSGALSPLPLLASMASVGCAVACLALLPFTARVAAARRRLFG